MTAGRHVYSTSVFQQPLWRSDNMARYIGVDLHRNQFTVCVIAENGRECLSEHRLEHLARFVAKLRATDEVGGAKAVERNGPSAGVPHESGAKGFLDEGGQFECLQRQAQESIRAFSTFPLANPIQSTAK